MTTPDDGWDGAYQRDAPAPWDIGHPQPRFHELANEGLFAGEVLDAGCGTGEHTLLAASLGATATGVDLSSVAIERARQKAVERGLTATFDAGDILEMPLPSDGYDTVIDSGLFHVFDDTDRARYVETLARVLRTGGALCLMCFSDRQPGDWGPRRVSRAELEVAFRQGWTFDRLEPARFDINPFPEASEVQAWLAVVRRV